MSEKKHPYMNQVVFSSHSGETGEPLNEIIWRQYYSDKVTQVEEQQQVVPAVIAAISGAVIPRADRDMAAKRGENPENTRRAR